MVQRTGCKKTVPRSILRKVVRQMFDETLERAMCMKGLNENAFLSLLRDEDYLSDNKFFAISRFILQHPCHIFYSRKVGDMMIACHRFEGMVTYVVRTSNPCTIRVDLSSFDFVVEYCDRKLVIDANLTDYQGEHDLLNDLRQQFLSEIMTRYFSKVLASIYHELRWFQ